MAGGGTSRALGKGAICGAAGTLGWLITAPMIRREFSEEGIDPGLAIYLILTFGLIGGAAAFWEAWQRGVPGKGVLFALGGFGLGVLGGGLGAFIGEVIVGATGLDGEAGSPGMVLTRVIVFSAAGAVLGGAVGMMSKNGRAVLSGVIGGALGGLVSGLTFDLLCDVFANLLMSAGPVEEDREIGIVGRAVLAALLGVGTGLFTTVVDQVTRRAWLRIDFARNEFKEWPIDAAATLIGRDQRAQVPLFTDKNLPALAAVIERHGAQYILVDPGSPIGVGLNGYKLIQPTPLKPKDVIQVGNLNLIFDMREGAAARAQAEASRHPQPAPGPKLTPSPTPPTAAMSAMTAPTTVTHSASVSPAAAGGNAVRRFVLVVEEGDRRGQRFSISGKSSVGREGGGIRLDWDAKVSRQHATVVPVSGGLQVSDLKSRNGTFVNGERVSVMVVAPGQSVKFGNTVLRVEAGDEAQPA